MASPGEAGGTVRIVLADDHAVLRAGLRRLLDDESDFEVVAEAASTDVALQVVRGHRPDVVVLDLNMPGGSSIEAITRIKAFAPHTSIVVLTMEDDPASIRAAYDAGASGYVLKEAAAEQLVATIRTGTTARQL